MSNENIFKDRSIITLIPFLTGLYLGFVNSNLIIISIFLVANTLIFYLIVMVLAKKAQDKNPKSEQDIYKILVNIKNFKFSGVASIMQWILSLISLYFLYQYRTDFIAYTLFWLLVIGFVFNLLRNFIVNLDVIKKAFKGEL